MPIKKKKKPLKFVNIEKSETEYLCPASCGLKMDIDTMIDSLEKYKTKMKEKGFTKFYLCFDYEGMDIEDGTFVFLQAEKIKPQGESSE